MLDYILCYKYHVCFIIALLLTINQAKLINWTHFVLYIVTNCIKASLGKALFLMI